MAVWVSQTLGSSLTLFPTGTVGSGAQTGLLEWVDPANNYAAVPNVSCNTSGTQIGPIPAYTIAFSPGSHDEFTHIIWTAPAAGLYSLSAIFTADDIGGTDVHILHNGSQLFTANLTTVGQTASFSSATPLDLNADDTLDFAVGIGPDGSYYGDTTGVAGTITLVSPPAQPPGITSGPLSQTVSAGATATFAVSALGNPLYYQWSLNGTNLPGATSSSLIVTNVTMAQLGTYAVVVSNALGFATSNAVLRMYPSIIVPFDGLVASWGKTATFTVQAWGSGPLAYQWYQDGIPIAGATTNAFTISSMQATNAGLYSVVVSSALGSVTNPPAQVVVNPAGVSLALYAGVTIAGVVGQTYGIQANTNLATTDGWQGLTNITLSLPSELWFDVNPANQGQRFYRVVPGPIPIP